MTSLGSGVVALQAGRKTASNRTTPHSLVHLLVLSRGLLSKAEGRTCWVLSPLISHLFLSWLFASEVLVQLSGRQM